MFGGTIVDQYYFLTVAVESLDQIVPALENGALIDVTFVGYFAGIDVQRFGQE